jgi:periplasmic mercuric ion binding protein
MKQQLFLILFTSIIFSTNIFAKGTTKMDTITVYGNCNECKERIEEAAYSIAGVKKATWNKKTKIFTVVYNYKKTNLEAISIAIAKVGHDVGALKASTESYKTLPSCCAYRDGKCSHE